MRYPRVKLGDVCDLVLGGTPSTAYPNYWGGGIPWLTPGEMGKLTSKYVSSTNRTLTREGLDKGSTLFPAYSVILSTRAPIGYVFINTVPMCTNQGCKTLVPNHSISPEYLYYNLLGRTEELNKLGTGTTFKELSSNVLKSLELPLPPLPIQREIVAKLEKELAKVDEMAESFKRMAELADEEFKSVLSETFEHVEGKKVKLGDIADVYDGDHQPPPQVEEGIPFLVISNVADGRLNFENTRKVPRQYYDSLSLNRKPQLNDLLLTVTGSYGIPVKVDVKREFCFQRHIALIRTTKLQLDFLFYFMKSKKSQQYFDKVATGTAQKTVSLSALRNMPIIYPKDEIQLSISKYADSTYKNYLIKKDYIYKGISLCSELRKSILQEAFS